MHSWQSMTGFATAEGTLAGKSYRAQLKSVNHKYFEMRVRAPRELFAAELLFRQKIRESLQRGSLDLQIERVDTGVDKNSETESWKKQLLDVKKRYLQAVSVLKPGLFERGALLGKILESPEPASEVSASTPENGEIEKFADSLSKKLCLNLISFRTEEGRGIQKAISVESATLARSLAAFRSILPGLQASWKNEMEKRIVEWAERLKITPPDQERIFQELVVILERRDVAEELQRIESHLKALNSMIEPVEKIDGLGKRLDFIAQELNREWTTLNNKVSDPEVSTAVASAKLAIDRIREQGLNVL